MTACEALYRLRERGFVVQVDGDKLIVTGPPAKDAGRAQEWLQAHWQELRDVVVIEAHPVVQMALEVFPGARLKGVKPAKG